MRRARTIARFHQIYEQIYENPLIPNYLISKKTQILRSSVSRNLIYMYKKSILKGPFIFVKPALNFKEYASFCTFRKPEFVYKCFEDFPGIVSRSFDCGRWNTLFICDTLLDFSSLVGFKRLILQEEKGVTELSKVTSLDWDTSMKRMRGEISRAEESTLYEEMPEIPWDKKEWTLYKGFQSNVRQDVMPVLKKHQIRFERYQKWISRLHEFSLIRPAFYPHGFSQYFAYDFLFETEYHQKLKRIFGLLPSTSVFFPVGKYLFARLSVLSKKERDDLFSLVHDLETSDLITDFSCSDVIKTWW